MENLVKCLHARTCFHCENFLLAVMSEVEDRTHCVSAENLRKCFLQIAFMRKISTREILLLALKCGTSEMENSGLAKIFLSLKSPAQLLNLLFKFLKKKKIDAGWFSREKS